MMLAQESLTGLPDSFWKNFCIALIVLLGIAGVVVGIWAATRKSEPTRLNDEPPIAVQKASKRYNHDAAENRFTNLERRVGDLEAWRDGLIDKLESDKVELLTAGEDRASRLHEHIETDRRELENKINVLPDRLIAMLRNLGAIK